MPKKQLISLLILTSLILTLVIGAQLPDHSRLHICPPPSDSPRFSNSAWLHFRWGHLHYQPTQQRSAGR